MAKIRIRLQGPRTSWCREAREGVLTRPDGSTLPVLVRLRPASAHPEIEALGPREAARALARLRNPSVLRLLHVSRVGDGILFVHEAFAGASLGRALEVLRGRGRQLPVRVAIEAAAEVARALEAVQGGPPGAGPLVVHPGPGPDDVLVDASGHVRIAGWTAMPDDGAAPLPRPGSAPPDGDAVPAGPHAVGALVVELLTGEPLDPAGGEVALRRAVIQVLARPGEAVPAPVVTLVRSCLGLDGEERPRLGDLAARLEAEARTLRGPGLRAWASEVVPGLLAAGEGTLPGDDEPAAGEVLPSPMDEVAPGPEPPLAAPPRGTLDEAPPVGGEGLLRAPTEEEPTVFAPAAVPPRGGAPPAPSPEPEAPAAVPVASSPPDGPTAPGRVAIPLEPPQEEDDELLEEPRAGRGRGRWLVVAGVLAVGAAAAALALRSRAPEPSPAVETLAAEEPAPAEAAPAGEAGEPDAPAEAAPEEPGGAAGPAPAASPEEPAAAPAPASSPTSRSPARSAGTRRRARRRGSATAARTAAPAPAEDVPRPRIAPAAQEVAPPPAEPTATPDAAAAPAAPAPSSRGGAPGGATASAPATTAPAGTGAPAASPAPASSPAVEATAPAAAPPETFRVEFRSADPSIERIDVRCHKGRAAGPPPVVIAEAGRGPCRVTGYRGNERVIDFASLTGPRVFTCFEGDSHTCR